MTNEIPFEGWIEKQGDDVRLAVCDRHPDVLVLVDKTNLAVYRYVIDKDMDRPSEAMEELMRMQELGIGGTDERHEVKTPEELTFLADNSEIVRIKNENNILRAARDMAVEDAKSIVVMLSNTRAKNAKLRELVESYGMIANGAVCDYYDRDEMLANANATASELGIEVGV